MNRSLLCLFLVACGDNAKPSEVTPDGTTPDTPAAPPRAVAVAGDFVTPGFSGVMSALELESLEMTQNVAPDGAIGSDPVLREVGDELFVVNRSNGNSVTILDASTFAFKEQLSTGAGSNPQDVAVFGSKLFVPAWDTAGVVVLTRGSTDIETIDLSALDPDGKPNCVSAMRKGTDVFVACGIIDDSFSPRGNGKVVVIDANTHTVRTTIELSTPNPFGVFTELPDGMGLVIPTFDFLAPTSRCLEHITTSPPASTGCFLQNADVGGYVVRTATQRIDATDMLWLVVNNGDFQNERARLWGYDLTTSTLWPDPVTPEAQVLTDLAVCPNGMVVVADKTMAANGLRVYENGTAEKTTAPLAIGLRPQSSPALACY